MHIIIRFQSFRQRIHFNMNDASSDWPPEPASEMDEEDTLESVSFPLTVRSGGTRSSFTFDLYKYKPRIV